MYEQRLLPTGYSNDSLPSMIPVSITLCVYALLGATRRWFFIVVFLYLVSSELYRGCHHTLTFAMPQGFTVPGTVTGIMFESSRKG